MKHRQIIAISALVVIITWEARAQWMPTNGPQGGTVFCVAIDSIGEPASVYAGTNGGGVYRSIDEGRSWSRVGASLSSLNISALEVMRSSKDRPVIFAGASTNGLFRSTNNGTTWSLVKKYGNIFSTEIMHSYVSPSGGSMLIAGAGNIVYRSTDLGAVWMHAEYGLSCSKVYAIEHLFVGSTVELFAATDSGLYRSTNEGGYWDPFGSEVPGRGLRTIFARRITPDSTELYVGALSGGVYRSGDRGMTWSAIGTGLNQYIVSHLRVARTEDGMYSLLAATSIGIFRLAESSNAWIPLEGSAPRMSILALERMQSSTGDVVLAGTTIQGVFRSDDFLRSWSRSNAGLNATLVRAIAHLPVANRDPGSFAAVNGLGVFRMDKPSNSWEPTKDDPPLRSAQSLLGLKPPLGETVLLAGTSAGVFRSTDEGLTWNRPSSGTITRSVVSMASHSIRPDSAIILAATSGAGVYRSTDWGQTWQQSNTGLPDRNVYSVTIAEVSPENTVALVATNSGLFRSTNNGLNWSPPGASEGSVQIGISLSLVEAETHGDAPELVAADTGLPIEACIVPSNSFRSVAFVRDTSGRTIFVAGTNNGFVLRSTDAGRTWTSTGESITNAEIKSLAGSWPEKNGFSVFAGTKEGVHRSVSLDGRWIKDSPPVTAGTVNALVVRTGLRNDRELFAATSGAGVWKRLVREPDSTLPAVSNVQAFIEIDRIILQWTPLPFATISGYRVYRGTDSASAGIIGFLSDTVFVDSTIAPAVSYVYFVAAVDTAGVEGMRSRAITAASTPPLVRSIILPHDSIQWHLRGMPLQPETTFAAHVFPGLYAGPYRYHLRDYSRIDTSIAAGEGFWVIYPRRGQTTFTGTPIDSLSREIIVGPAGEWVLVSGISSSVPFDRVTISGAGTLAQRLYAYNGVTYDAVTSLEPGYGYWIFVNPVGEGGLARIVIRSTIPAPPIITQQ